ncbi:MAG: hypothetical protein H7838_07150 [Magnetococcus sp. DMHC-8]
MVEVRFQVSGQNKKVFDVVFMKDGTNMTANCSCTTGVDGICQHRINILSGSTQEIISGNADDVKKVTSWIGGTDIGKALHDVVRANLVLRNATDDFNDARKRLGKAMRD